MSRVWESLGRYDSSERRWRHLDTCQYRTILIATVPRVDCDEHGVRQVRVPWAEERSRFTALFEALVIDWLQATESIAASGDDRLAKTRYLWLTHPSRLEGEARSRIEALRHGALKTARAFRYKEHASRLWGYVRRGMAERLWKQWLHGALRCRLEPVRRVARMIRDYWYAGADEKIVFDKFHIMKHLAM